MSVENAKRPPAGSGFAAARECKSAPNTLPSGIVTPPTQSKINKPGQGTFVGRASQLSHKDRQQGQNSEPEEEISPISEETNNDTSEKQHAKNGFQPLSSEFLTEQLLEEVVSPSELLELAAAGCSSGGFLVRESEVLCAIHNFENGTHLQSLSDAELSHEEEKYAAFQKMIKSQQIEWSKGMVKAKSKILTDGSSASDADSIYGAEAGLFLEAGAFLGVFLAKRAEAEQLMDEREASLAYEGPQELIDVSMECDERVSAPEEHSSAERKQQELTAQLREAQEALKKREEDMAEQMKRSINQLKGTQEADLERAKERAKLEAEMVLKRRQQEADAQIKKLKAENAELRAAQETQKRETAELLQSTKREMLQEEDRMQQMVAQEDRKRSMLGKELKLVQEELRTVRAHSQPPPQNPSEKREIDTECSDSQVSRGRSHHSRMSSKGDPPVNSKGESSLQAKLEAIEKERECMANENQKLRQALAEIQESQRPTRTAQQHDVKTQSTTAKTQVPDVPQKTPQDLEREVEALRLQHQKRLQFNQTVKVADQTDLNTQMRLRQEQQKIENAEMEKKLQELQLLLEAQQKEQDIAFQQRLDQMKLQMQQQQSVGAANGQSSGKSAILSRTAPPKASCTAEVLHPPSQGSQSEQHSSQPRLEQKHPPQQTQVKKEEKDEERKEQTQQTQPPDSQKPEQAQPEKSERPPKPRFLGKWCTSKGNLDSVPVIPSPAEKQENRSPSKVQPLPPDKQMSEQLSKPMPSPEVKLAPRPIDPQQPQPLPASPKHLTSQPQPRSLPPGPQQPPQNPGPQTQQQTSQTKSQHDNHEEVAYGCSGMYIDLKHDGAVRTMSALGDIITVKGKDSEGSSEWTVMGRVEVTNKHLIVDFSSKGGPENLIGTMMQDGIMWQDGNKWLKIVNPAGTYSDPKHDGARRTISVSGSNVTVQGKDSEAKPEWQVNGHINAERIQVDFQPKGGPIISGTVNQSGIVWQDGNEWRRVQQNRESAQVGNVTGTYADPKHHGAIRTVSVSDRTLAIMGKDSDDGLQWIVIGQPVDSSAGTFKVDFSPKGGPKEVMGTDNRDGITWADGNKWVKLSNTIENLSNAQGQKSLQMILLTPQQLSDVVASKSPEEATSQASPNIKQTRASWTKHQTLASQDKNDQLEQLRHLKAEAEPPDAKSPTPNTAPDVEAAANGPSLCVPTFINATATSDMVVGSRAFGKLPGESVEEVQDDTSHKEKEEMEDKPDPEHFEEPPDPIPPQPQVSVHTRIAPHRPKRTPPPRMHYRGPEGSAQHVIIDSPKVARLFGQQSPDTVPHPPQMSPTPRLTPNSSYDRLPEAINECEVFKVLDISKEVTKMESPKSPQMWTLSLQGNNPERAPLDDAPGHWASVRAEQPSSYSYSSFTRVEYMSQTSRTGTVEHQSERGLRAGGIDFTYTELGSAQNDPSLKTKHLNGAEALTFQPKGDSLRQIGNEQTKISYLDFSGPINPNGSNNPNFSIVNLSTPQSPQDKSPIVNLSRQQSPQDKHRTLFWNKSWSKNGSDQAADEEQLKMFTIEMQDGVSVVRSIPRSKAVFEEQSGMLHDELHSASVIPTPQDPPDRPLFDRSAGRNITSPTPQFGSPRQLPGSPRGSPWWYRGR